MIKNYFKIAIRNLIGQKGNSIINIGGLAIGIASFTLLMVYILHELSYDHFHKNAESIYRISSTIKRPDGSSMKVPTGLEAMSYTVPEQMPEILYGTKLFRVGDVRIESNNDLFFQNDLFYVDSNFTRIFSFEVLNGDLNKTLSTADYLAITEKTALKIFNKTDIIGESVKMMNENYIIGAVLKDIPDNSHFRFDALTPFISNNNLDRFYDQHGFDFYMYFLTKENIDEEELFVKFRNITNQITEDRLLAEGMAGSFEIKSDLQPLLKIHLYSNFYFEIGPQGKIETVYTFSLLALFILIIAIINFVNLVTSYGENRAKEVGVRKVVGANNTLLRLQFTGESIFVTFIALIIGVVLSELFVKEFGQIIGRNLEIEYSASFILLVLFFGLIVGLISSIYPSFYLTRFEPVKVLKGATKTGKRSYLKTISVFVQFGIAIFLIISVLAINLQLKYIQSKDLGFDKENIVVVDDVTKKIRSKYDALKQELLSISSVSSVCASQSSPGYGRSYQNAFKRGEDPDNAILINENRVQANYISTYNFEFVEGRDFDPNLASDSNSFIINETAVKQLGLANPLGEYINVWKSEGKIIGVIKDFHFFSFHTLIEPLALTYYSDYFNKISIKIEGGNKKEVIAKISEIFKSYDQAFFFNYEFVDNRFNQLYRSEEQTNSLLLIGSVLAIIIALLGLFALTTFTVNERTKEIGIRKAMGASVGKLIRTLLYDIVKWILIVNVVAWPLAYWFMNSWLNNFAYRIELKFWIFLLSLVIVFIISISTIILQVYKKASSNPIEALKYE